MHRMATFGVRAIFDGNLSRAETTLLHRQNLGSARALDAQGSAGTPNTTGDGDCCSKRIRGMR